VWRDDGRRLGESLNPSYMKPRINVYKMFARASWERRPRVAAVSVRRWDDAVVTRDRRRERR